MDASLVLEDFISRSRIPHNNLSFKIPFIVVFFRMVHKEKICSRNSSVSIGPFQKVQREVIYFLFVVRKNVSKLSKNCNIH